MVQKNKFCGQIVIDYDKMSVLNAHLLLKNLLNKRFLNSTLSDNHILLHVHACIQKII